MSIVERHPASYELIDNKSDSSLFTKTPNNVLNKQISRRELGIHTWRLAQGLFGMQLLNRMPISIQNNQTFDFFSNSNKTDVEVEPQNTKIHNTAFIDFGEEYKFDTFTQEIYPNWEELKERLLGDNYIPPGEFWKSFFEFVAAGNDKEEFDDYLLETNTPYALMLGLQNEIKEHGFHVIRTHTNVLKEYGYISVPRIVEIQPTYSSESLRPISDNLGNKGISIETKSDYFIEKLKEVDEPIINISFQFGKLKIFHARKKFTYTKDTTAGEEAFAANMPPIKKISLDNGSSKFVAYDSVGSEDGSFHYRFITLDEYLAYRDKALIEGFAAELHADELDTNEIVAHGAITGEDAGENVLELFKLVDEFPEKLFIVAGGNYYDDWRPVREQFKDRWPQNLIVAGQWNSDTNSPDGVEGQILGADIYVDMAHFGMESSRPYASNATAILSSIANMLYAQGRDLITNGQMPSIKQTLLNATVETEFDINDSNLKLHDVENIEALANHYVERPKETARFLDKKAVDEIIRSGR